MLADILNLDANENICYLSESSNTSSSSTRLAGDFAAMVIPTNVKSGDIVENKKVNMSATLKEKFPAELVILEQPAEKFRFRYISEMHGTHGSLNGINSKKTPKTFPEVELKNFDGHGVIRCSLFQTDLENPSPHSHQLVVRKEDKDVFDPHDLYVSPEIGYVAQFQNMGIIHTAKKYIIDVLFNKKIQQYKLLEGNDFSMRRKQEIRKETEKEAKAMNLNQVRLRFEAYKIENGKWTQIAKPVYSNPINNRKSAQTGELRICRLSSIVGSVIGGDDLILLVEKVSKKNIQVRFFELNDDEEITWEAQARFRESDVHHQYAIVVQTPPYKNRDVDKHVHVFIELIRPSDDERSLPVEFRYKPRDAMLSRKRRRTCSTATTSSSSVSSSELPEPVAKNIFISNGKSKQTISEEFDKEKQLNDFCADTESFMNLVGNKLEDLKNFYSFDLGILENNNISSERLETDDASIAEKTNQKNIIKMIMSQATTKNSILNEIFEMFDRALKDKNLKNSNLAKRVCELFMKYSNASANGDSILHDVISNGNVKIMMKTLKIIEIFQLFDVIQSSDNLAGENPLHCACLHNKGEYIRPLFSLGFSLNKQDVNGNTPLHIAIREENKTCLDYFLQILPIDVGRIDVNLSNDDGLTPLHMAIRKNNLELSIAIMRYNSSSANVVNSKDGNNALHLAVMQENPELVAAVLEHGSILDVEILNKSNLSALDLTKDVDIKVRQEIINIISSRRVIFENITVKEEYFENDSENASEDDDDMSSISQHQIEEIDLKKEIYSDSSCLANPVLFSQLVQILSKDDKWKKLVEYLKMHHLLCLWSSAKTMLLYVCNKKIPIETLHRALLEVDPTAAQMLFEN